MWSFLTEAKLPVQDPTDHSATYIHDAARKLQSYHRDRQKQKVYVDLTSTDTKTFNVPRHIRITSGIHVMY